MSFFDLNIPGDQSSQTRIILANELVKLGYDGVAWNYTLERLPQVTRKEPAVAESKVISLQDYPNFSQYSRLTLLLQDTSQIHSMSASNPILQSYDIISVLPMNEKMFHTSCTTLDVDIITFDLSKRQEFNFKPATLKQAIKRGIYFEIALSSALKDTNSRRHLLSNAMNLIRCTKGKNIILSSEARRALELRGPYDIMNLGILCGLSSEVAKNSLSTNCQSLILHAATRKTHKGVLQVESTKMDTE